MSGNERGYALVAAVTAVALFGYLAFLVLAANHGAVALAAGWGERTRLKAAADAGVSLAVRALGAESRGARWSPDGRARELQFDGVDLTIVVEDEMGKAPVNILSDQQVRALFAGAGAKDAALDALVVEFREWVTDPATRALIAPGGSSANGGPVRGGPMLTPDEFALLRDMTPRILARVAPVTTVFPEDGGGFRPEHAQPLARAAMTGVIEAASGQAGLAPAIEGQRPSEDLAEAGSLVGDPMTVRVTARDRGGGVARRVVIVEFTGDPARPYWIRFAD